MPNTMVGGGWGSVCWRWRSGSMSIFEWTGAIIGTKSFSRIRVGKSGAVFHGDRWRESYKGMK